MDRLRRAAAAVPGVRQIEKLAVRRSEFDYYVDVSGSVKAAIQGAAPGVRGVLVHMEPFVGA